MAVAKVILNGTTLMDVTQDTVAADKLLQTYTATKNDGTKVTGTLIPSVAPTLQSKTVSPSTSQQTVSPDSGYDGLSSVTVNAMPSGTAGTPTATKGTVSNHSVSVTPSVTNTTGYITGGTKSGTAVTVTAEELASGTKNITENGEGIDVVGYLDVDVNVTPTLQTKSVTPTESAQTVTPDSGYDGLSQVNVARIPTNYIVPSGTKSITSSGTTDVTNYANASVSAGAEGTPTATKSAVNNHSVTVTPSVTNTGGFISGTTKTGTAVTVTAAELESGTKSITENGTGIDVSGYSAVDVNVSGGGGGANVNVQILGTMPYDVHIPINASQSGNTVSIPNDSMFVIAVYGMLDVAPTTGTVTKDVIGADDPAVVIYPGENGGTITLEGMF